MSGLLDDFLVSDMSNLYSVPLLMDLPAHFAILAQPVQQCFQLVPAWQSLHRSKTCFVRIM